jgi:hypothetical protein
VVEAVQRVNDTPQQRKKDQIVKLMRQLIEQVESGQLYGEFGISFSAQNGQIGHFEKHQRETYK